MAPHPHRNPFIFLPEHEQRILLIIGCHKRGMHFGSKATPQKLAPEGASRIFVKLWERGSNDQRLSIVVQKILSSFDHVIPRGKSLAANCVSAIVRMVFVARSIS